MFQASSRIPPNYASAPALLDLARAGAAPGRHRREEPAPAHAGVKLGPISKRGNGYLRRLLVNSLPSGLTRWGAMSVLCSKRAKEDPWLAKLLETKERKVAACALANKMARIGWAVMMRQEDFRRRRHDQPCPDLGEPGAVLPTGHARGLKAHAVKTVSRVLATVSLPLVGHA